MVQERPPDGGPIVGLEYRLNRNDHKVVEDMLATRYRTLDGIAVEAHNVQRQEAVIEAARSCGVAVSIDLMTDKLAYPGFDYGDLPYLTDGRVPIEGLLRSPVARDHFVAECISFQEGRATRPVAPHVFAGDDDERRLNLLLAERAINQYGADAPVRVIAAVPRRWLTTGDNAAQLADEYAQLGVDEIELRVSPLGGRDESLTKIRAVHRALAQFRPHFSHITLSQQGLLGAPTLALGLIDTFTVGVGMKEHYDFSKIKTPQERGDDDEHLFGPRAGVYLPAASTTVDKGVATVFYQDVNLRSRLRCAHQCCPNSIDGPVRDARKHYLHSRLGQLDELADKPEPWRATSEHRRLTAALETLRILNEHVPPKGHPIKTRTLEALVQLLDEDHDASSEVA